MDSTADCAIGATHGVPSLPLPSSVSPWRGTARRIDGFTADLSPRLLGNCLGRGELAEAAACYRHYGNLPRVDAGYPEIRISQAPFDGT